MIVIQTKPIKILALDISGVNFVLEEILPDEIIKEEKFHKELDRNLSDIAEKYENKFRTYKSAFVFGPAKYKNQQLHNVMRILIVFSNIPLPDKLDSIINDKLPAMEHNYMELSVLCNMETKRLSIYGPSTAHPNTRRRSLLNLITPFVTKLSGDLNVIKYTLDGEEYRFVPKPPIDSARKEIDWINEQYDKSIAMIKYDGTRVIAICEEDDEGETAIRCYTRHCFPIKTIDERIDKACCRMRLVGKMPFILEMEAFHEDYNSSKCSALIKAGEIDKLRFRVFNYIPLTMPKCLFHVRFDILAEIDKANIEGINRAECYGKSSFSEFMRVSRARTEKESYVEGAVLWHRDEISSTRGGLVKIKYRQSSVLNIDGISVHKNGEGINLSCSGMIDGISVRAEVPLHGDRNMRIELIKIFGESKKKALECVGDTIEVVHFGIEVNGLRHPHAMIK